MKYVLIILGVFLLGCVSAPDDVAPAEINTASTASKVFVEPTIPYDTTPIDTSASSFKFTGYSGIKEKSGTFSELQGELYIESDAIVGMSGTIQAASVDTGIAGLDKHLKEHDFFDVENYPEISFTSMKIESNTMTGPLSFHGVTHQVSFPVTVSDDMISADFLLDTTPFGMTNGGVDKDVRIEFEFKK